MKSKETPQTKSTRTSVVLVVVLSVLALGLPLFLYTTSIHRAELPIADIETRMATFEQVKIQVPVYLNISTESSLLQDTQAALDAAVDGRTKRWSIKLIKGDADPTADYVVNIEPSSAPYDFTVSQSSKLITASSGQDNLSVNLANTLVNDVFGEEIKTVESLWDGSKKSSDIVFPYSKKYHAVFNLLAEGGKPVDWDIERAIEKMGFVFESLKHYSEFKVSTQIQYYSKLRTEPVFDSEKNANIIPLGDLSTFINFGDWNLNTHDITPSINFIVYFSNSNYNNVPLLVENSTTNSFLVPQWGGVQLYNMKMPILEGSTVKIGSADLDPIFEVFTSQLFQLLGVPKSPRSPWMRIDSFHRITALRNLKRSLENLSALVKLSNSLNGITIPESTRDHVVDALRSYDDAVSYLSSESKFTSAVESASNSVESSDKAFFEKEMVQQAHFPSEHKLAVYLPLLGPICSIVLFGAIKLIKSWKKEKNLGKEEEEKKNI